MWHATKAFVTEGNEIFENLGHIHTAEQQEVPLGSGCYVILPNAQTRLQYVQWSHISSSYTWLHPSSPCLRALGGPWHSLKMLWKSSSRWLAFRIARSDSNWKRLIIFFLTLSTPNRFGREKQEHTHPYHSQASSWILCLKRMLHVDVWSIRWTWALAESTLR